MRIRDCVKFEKLRFVKSLAAPTWTAPQLLARLTVAVLEADLEGGDARDAKLDAYVCQPRYLIIQLNAGEDGVGAAGVPQLAVRFIVASLGEGAKKNAFLVGNVKGLLEFVWPKKGVKKRPKGT